jgi:hypothetical protein
MQNAMDRYIYIYIRKRKMGDGEKGVYEKTQNPKNVEMKLTNMRAIGNRGNTWISLMFSTDRQGETISQW